MPPRGCIPTKALLHVGRARRRDPRQPASSAILVESEPQVDWGKVLSFKDGVVGRMYKGLSGLVKKHKVELVEGEGKLAGERDGRGPDHGWRAEPPGRQGDRPGPRLLPARPPVHQGRRRQGPQLGSWARRARTSRRRSSWSAATTSGSSSPASTGRSEPRSRSSRCSRRSLPPRTPTSRRRSTSCC